MTFQVDIINPKAKKLLQDLADMNLISIRQTSSNDALLKIAGKIRAKAEGHPPSIEDITKEVEEVRAKRYVRSKRQAGN